MASDYCYVDPEDFAVFVGELFSGPVTRNPIYKELARGFLVISLVMLERAGHPLNPAR